MVVRIGQKSAQPRRTFFRQWREDRGLTQEQLAERMNTTKSAVSKMELGRNRYNQSSLEAWADALGCSPADLISRPPPAQDQRIALGKLIERAEPETQRLIETILKSGTK